MEIAAAPDTLYPAVGMHSLGEEVLLNLNAEWGTEEDDGQMIVDSHEEHWSRLHDVRVTGTVSLIEEKSLVVRFINFRLLFGLFPAFPLHLPPPCDDKSGVFVFDSVIDIHDTTVE